MKVTKTVHNLMVQRVMLWNLDYCFNCLLKQRPVMLMVTVTAILVGVTLHCRVISALNALQVRWKENVDSNIYPYDWGTMFLTECFLACTEKLKSTCAVTNVRECKSHFRVTLILQVYNLIFLGQDLCYNSHR